MSDSINKELLHLLKLCKNKANKEGGKAIGFKLRSFTSAIQVIQNYPNMITNVDQVKGIKGLGKGMLSRINEFCNTGTIQEIQEELKRELQPINDSREVDIEGLQTITGVGVKKAEKLYNNGWRLFDLLSTCQEPLKAEKLINDKVITHHQYVGAKYYDDIEKRIPHKEIDLANKYLQKYIEEFNPYIELQILGSYRRNADTSGDIDLLLTNPKVKTLVELEKTASTLPTFVQFLTDKGFIVDHLTKEGKSKYMGLCRIENNPIRRIDIRFVPYESKGAAILYFTGSGEFNPIMRKWAIHQRYKLNEYGLWRKIGNGKITKHTEFELCECSHSESAIFNELNMPYLTPQERHNVSSSEFIKYRTAMDITLNNGPKN
jgi:DNA polymerase/3'-5' exonuclease PolX